jgi:hypothetical protein
MEAHIERILDAARTAPSHDNLQPWRFTVDADTVSFGVDPDRNGSADESMARIGLGAAIECACIAASRMGIAPRIQPPREGALVTMTFSDPKRLPDPDLSRTRRATNRRVYDGRALDDATLRALRDAVPQRDLAVVHWFGRERVRALGPIVEQADEIAHLDPAFRERALAAVRFDVKDREVVSRGLPVASLELSTAERAALAGLKKPIGSGMTASAAKTLGTRARRLMESASGVLIVTTTGSDPMSDVDVGRSVQRAWMALTQKGLAAHPMTTVMSLALAAEPDERLSSVLASFRGAFPHLAEGSRIAFLMRFGFADAPTLRSGRYELAESVSG